MSRVAFLVVILLASEVLACGRCGLFGRRCRYYRAPSVVSKTVAVPQQIVNIANVYPQGQTVYSVGQVAQLYATNPALAITTAGRVADSAIASLTAAVNLGSITNEQVAQVAKVQAAVAHMQAAVGAQPPSSVTLRITQGAGGINVERMSDDEAPPPPTEPSQSLLAQKCSQCHGVALEQPKGNHYFDAGAKLQPREITAALRILSGEAAAPEAMQELVSGLTQEEKGRLMSELLSLETIP